MRERRARGSALHFWRAWRRGSNLLAVSRRRRASSGAATCPAIVVRNESQAQVPRAPAPGGEKRGRDVPPASPRKGPLVSCRPRRAAAPIPAGTLPPGTASATPYGLPPRPRACRRARPSQAHGRGRPTPSTSRSLVAEDADLLVELGRTMSARDPAWSDEGFGRKPRVLMKLQGGPGHARELGDGGLRRARSWRGRGAGSALRRAVGGARQKARALPRCAGRQRARRSVA